MDVKISLNIRKLLIKRINLELIRTKDKIIKYRKFN